MAIAIAEVCENAAILTDPDELHEVLKRIHDFVTRREVHIYPGYSFSAGEVSNAKSIHVHANHLCSHLQLFPDHLTAWCDISCFTMNFKFEESGKQGLLLYFSES